MLKTAQLFQSGMILQREKPCIIWGTADAGAEIEVSIQNQTAKAVAGGDGSWKAALPGLIASEEEVLTIQTDTEKLVYTDVVIGEVWIAGGQSNMEFLMRFEKHIEQVRENCSNRNIRFYDVPKIAFEGQEECFDYSKVGIWRKADEENIDYFSAVGYYFACELEKELHIPVGIIGCNWGGTVAASWMKEETLRKVEPEWTVAYDLFRKQVDWEDYMSRQRVGIQNDRGNLIGDPFYKYVMPCNRTPEECDAFFAGMAQEGSLPNMKEGELTVESFPGSLFEHMVKTIAPVAVRGVLWYQGESEDLDERVFMYKNILTGMIGDWRTLWGESMLPFLIVQLPGFDSWLDVENHNFAEIRRVQEAVTKQTPNTWLCSISDAGEKLDIHPKNKKVVGHRLALLAEGHVYQKEGLCDAPVVSDYQFDGRQITIGFSNAEGGLVFQGESVQALEVLADGETVPFETQIQNEKLMISIDKTVTDSVEVRFAQEKFYIVNLYNRANIPAIPFTFIIEREGKAYVD